LQYTLTLRQQSVTNHSPQLTQTATRTFDLSLRQRSLIWTLSFTPKSDSWLLHKRSTGTSLPDSLAPHFPIPAGVGMRDGKMGVWEPVVGESAVGVVTPVV